MGQTIWFRQASELYYLAYMSPITGIGAARAKYRESLELACSTGKVDVPTLDETIKRRATSYAVARNSGKSPEEAFDLAAQSVPIILKNEDGS